MRCVALRGIFQSTSGVGVDEPDIINHLAHLVESSGQEKAPKSGVVLVIANSPTDVSHYGLLTEFPRLLILPIEKRSEGGTSPF